MNHYTTGELAKLCGTTVRTVQFYDAKGLLKPSELTEGGRRLYSDKDRERLAVILFLKELGFSLKEIGDILEDDSSAMLQLLLDGREQEILQEIEENRKRLLSVRTLRERLPEMKETPVEAIGFIATLMKQREELRALTKRMLIVGIFMDIAQIGGLLLSIFTGNWWIFGAGITFTVIAGILITRAYYTHTAYVCPEEHTIFRPPFGEWFFSRHSIRNGGIRKLRCPFCREKQYCLEIYVPDYAPVREGKDLIWTQAEGTK